MRKLLFVIVTFLSLNLCYGQSMKDYVENKIAYHLSNKLNDRYKGGLSISDVSKSGNILIVEGSFRYQIKTWVGNGNTVTRKFKASVKQILDDISIQKLCYVFIEYGPNEPQKSCKCTDGNFAIKGNLLYVE